MKIGKTCFHEFGAELLDLNIENSKFGVKYYTVDNSQFYFVSNMYTNFQSFDGSFPTAHGKFQIEIEPKRKLFSFSPNILNSPTFTIENFSSRSSKNVVFSSSFPFMINKFHFLINGAQTKEESSFFANIASPLNLNQLKGEIKFLLSPSIDHYLNRFMVNLRSQLAEISFIHKLNSSEIQFAYSSPSNFFKCFADISKRSRVSYDLGAIIKTNPIKVAYLYDSSSLLHHNIKCLFNIEQLQIGSKLEFATLKFVNKTIAFGQTFNDFSYAFSSDLISKFALQVSTTLQTPYNITCTLGLDSRNYLVNASAILLLIE